MLLMMMYSAITQCSKPIKFWLVENFFSPQFKEEAPAFAAMMGAEVVFVSYKWPHYLYKQNDKIREIWAYKINFPRRALPDQPGTHHISRRRPDAARGHR